MPRFRQEKVRLKDLALQLNLSERAVAQALRDRPGTVKVSEATRQRVQDLAKELGYRQNMAARSLTTGKSGMLGILNFMDLTHSRAIYLTQTAKEFRRRGITTLAIQGEKHTTEACDQCIEALLDAGVDGVLILQPGGCFSEAHIQRLADYDIPAVSIGFFGLSNVPQFKSERKKSFQKITMHLVESGYQSITLLMRPELSPFASENLISRATQEGFQAAIKEARSKGSKAKFRVHLLSPEIAEPDSNAMMEVHPLYHPGYFGMRELIKNNQVPEALVCISDGWAMGALRACAEAGIRVPEDMALTGYGNEPLSSAGAVPLTSLREPFEEMCDNAISQLIEMVNTGKPPSQMRVVMPCKLMVRQSTVRIPISVSPGQC